MRGWFQWHAVAVVFAACLPIRAAVNVHSDASAQAKPNAPASLLGCTCNWCPGYEAQVLAYHFEGIGIADLLKDTICPPMSACPEPPSSLGQAFNYCYGQDSDGTNGACNCGTGHFLREDCDETLRGNNDEGYVGCQTKTRFGLRCQKWSAQSPHEHTRTGRTLKGNFCRNPGGVQQTIWCYTEDPNQKWQFCDPLLGHGLPEWVDPDTPEDARVTQSKIEKGRPYGLVFSDEFEVDGRRFDDGSDPRWTALSANPFTTQQVNTYSPRRAHTEDGRLKIEARHLGKDSKTGRAYETAMLQTWNKFCFTGGVVDMVMKLPGRSGGESAGLWPAAWIMGNLGRAIYQDSTDGVWPFSATDECPDKKRWTENSVEAQSMSACSSADRIQGWKKGYDKARGAPEIDILEGKLGSPDYQHEKWIDRVREGTCDAVMGDAFTDEIINPLPFAATSFQLAPGIPATSRMRPERLSGDPHVGCIWPLSPFNWYSWLWPSNRSTYPGWPTSRCEPEDCPTFPNLDDFGKEFEDFQLDTYSANTHLAPSSFEDQGLRIRLEWRTDVAGLQEDGTVEKGDHVFLAWYIDDMETAAFQLHSEMLRKLGRPYEDWELIPRGIPREASYLLLNIDMSPDWGWPICHGCSQECRSCVDCANPDCMSCRDAAGRKFLINLCKFLHTTSAALEVDHVRVYSDSGTCEPQHAPTKGYIGDNADRYYFNETSSFRVHNKGDPPTDYPLLCVRAGGGECELGASNACGGPQRGRCVYGRCMCNYNAKLGEGWTGPHCLAQAAGPSRSCPFFLEHDQQALDSRQFLPPDNCVAPLPEDHPGVEHSIFTPSSGSVVEIMERNCKKVYAFHDIMIRSHRGSHDPDFARRVAHAVSLCNLIWYDGALGECCPEQRANISLKAWGELVMNGAQCCNLPGPPYCIENQGNWEMFSHVLPLVVSVSLIAFVMVLSTFSRPGSTNALLGNVRAGGAFFGWSKSSNAAGTDPLDPQYDMYPERNSIERGGLGDVDSAGQLDAQQLQVPPLFNELKQILSSSFIARDFPNEADSWATIFAAIFGQLAHHFGFQDDSVKNQFQHLLSLWQSQASFLRDQDDPDDSVLVDALEQLANKLLHGFDTWKGKLGAAAEQFHVAEACPSLEKLAALPGDQVAGVGPSSRPFVGRPAVRAVDSAIYLLVWGEAGNIRFCPDMLLFLIDSIRRDADAAIQDSGDITRCPARPAGSFLRAVIRPMYNAIFDETYDSVNIDPRSGEDKKKQQAECVRFAPPDKANHDDWNELFHDMARFNDRLLQQRISFPWQPSGSWPSSGSGRLATLQRVDWHACLGGFKTHREVHSYLGVFAALHRIVFLHEFMFVLVVLLCVESQPRTFPNGPPITGRRMMVRVAVLGMIAPVHVAMDALACRAVCPDRTGWAHRLHRGCMVFPPVLTYVAVRILDMNANGADALNLCLTIHFVVSGMASFRVLFIPDKFKVDHITCQDVFVAAGRHIFWLSIFAVKCAFAYFVTIDSTARLVKNLEVSLPSQNLYVFYCNLFSPAFDLEVMVWGLIWFCSFVCFVADTLLWVMIAYCFLGLMLALRQKAGALVSFWKGREVECIDSRFKNKVLAHCEDSDRVWRFNTIWNAVIEEMHKEHKLTTTELKKLQYGLSERRGRYFWTEPRLFEGTPNICIRLAGRPHWLDSNWPRNPEAQWRFRALGRALSLKMPRPFRVPHVPGLTVLIPHYNESILQTWDTLCEGHTDAASDEEQKEVILLRWIILRYPDEWTKLIESSEVLQDDSNEIEDILNPQARQEIEVWASMRTQTLFRTISGLCTYDTALRRLAPDSAGLTPSASAASNLANLADRNADSSGSPSPSPGVVTDVRGGLGGRRRSQRSSQNMLMLQEQAQAVRQRGWQPDECFRCLVAMQRYAFFDDTQLRQVETMLAELPSSLAIAYIDYSRDETPNTLRTSGVHEKQHRRYFACLFDRSCDFLDAERKRRKPRYRVELPGFPILGNGKGDNQNCAVIFSRGEFIQAIDANQGGYLEQMFLLPNLLGEFREDPRLIVGAPEHIISDFGSIGDFAASAELTFGTLVQRSMAALGGRMHYGHPDVMNKIYMMHQGGVSKATQTIHLSEDIFAGMDFVLRGGSIRHREYFHVAKGRDLGFNAVLSFFSKLSNGTGEQLLTRQVLRLCRECGLERVLPIYYNHAGYYLTQFFFTFSVKMLSFAWLVISLNGIDGSGKAMNQRYPIRGKDPDKQWEHIKPGVLVSNWLSELFGPLFLLLILSTSLPLLMELWIQEGLVRALTRLMKQFFTLAPLHFIFQGKVIGSYIINNIRYGGAKYIATGRELPTHRKPFVGPDVKGKTGLYEDFAMIAHYDGMRLLFVMVCIGPFQVGAVDFAKVSYWWMCVSFVVVSWLWAPYWFNPYQFSPLFVRHDCSNWWGFFVKDTSKRWRQWYAASLEEGTGVRANVVEITGWLLYLAPIYGLLTMKLHAFIVLYESSQDPVFNGLKLWGGTRSVPLSVVFAAAPGLLSVLLGAPLLVCIKRFRRLCRAHPSDIEASQSRGGDVDEEPSPALCSLVVSVLTVLEIWLGSVSFWKAGWNACAVNVLVYKVVTIDFVACCAECWLRLRTTPRSGAGPVMLWLQGFRLGRDTVTSAVILLPLLNVSLCGWLLGKMCRRCDASVHNFCVFRSWGDYRRRAVWVLTPTRQVSMRSEAPPLSRTNSLDSKSAMTGTELESFSLRSTLIAD